MLTFLDNTYVLSDKAKEYIKETDSPFFVLYSLVYSSDGTFLDAGDKWDSWDDVLGCIKTCWESDKEATEEFAKAEWDENDSLRENVVYVRAIDALLLVDPEGEIHGAYPANFLRKEVSND